MEEWRIREKGEGYILWEAAVRCPNEPPPPSLPEIWLLGGAYPYAVEYDPRKVEVKWFSANSIYRGELSDFLKKNGDKVIRIIPASVHTCWKKTKRQRVVLLRRE